MPQSAEFVLFCIAAVSLHWLVPARWQGAVLLLCSVMFLGYWDLPSLVLLIVATTAVYALPGRPVPLIVGLALLLCGLRSSPWVLLGVGFYVLKLIHYAVEREAGTFPPHGILSWFRYMLFFPTLAVGPIHRFEDFLRDERRKRWDGAMFAAGIERAIHGYAKMVVLADFCIKRQLGPYLLGALPPHSGRAAFSRCVIYGLDLYFTFAGSSDIAIGLGLLLGYRVGENFDYPFLSRNLGEFWQSWHMSLSAWCRRYVFLPVTLRWHRPALGVLLAMLAVALWHEPSLRYLLWGMYHAAGIAIWHGYRKWAAPRLPALPALGQDVAATLLTFTFIMAGFAITRNPSLSAIFGEYQRMLGWPG